MGNFPGIFPSHITTSDNENVDAVQRHALDITWCGCSETSGSGLIIASLNPTYGK